MNDLVEFMLARIAEDESVARAASHLAPSGPDPTYVSLVDPLRVMQLRFDPARVLAECEVKRRIVEGCAVMRRTLDYYGVPTSFDDENILALLALPYADHPDYDPAWRP